MAKKDPGTSLMERVWYSVAKMACWMLWNVVYRIRIAGQEHIPEDGSVLIVSNHQSHFDPPCVGTCIPRQSNFLARDTLFKSKFFGALIRGLGAIPIDREGKALSGLKETLRRLKKGGTVLVFPEGTRSPDGQIREFQAGFTTLAVRSRSPIVPAAIAGAYEAFPRGKKFPRLGRLAVVFGEAIPSETIRDLEEQELIALVHARVEDCFEEAKKLRVR